MADALSVHNVKGVFYGYKVMIGGRRFYWAREWGIDRPSSANMRKALTATGIYRAEWDRLKLAGASGWTDDALARAKALARKAVLGVDAPRPIDAAAAPLAPASGTHNATAGGPSGGASAAPALTLFAAVDAYVARRKADADAQQISGARADTIAYALRRFKLYAADGALAAFGLDECRAFVNHFASRPAFGSGKKKGQRMAPDTTADTIVLTRGFFADAADRGDWQAPASLDKCFSFDREKLLTEGEQEARSAVRTFTVPELATLWRACSNERQALYLLLGLNCGFTQKEIATLRRSHCYLDATDKEGKPRPYIERRRNKTRAKVKTAWRWRLWPEAAYLLRREMARENPEGLALLSREGNRLCDVTTKSRYDLVRQQWLAMQKAAKRLQEVADLDGGWNISPVPALGFKFLRKTGADMIRKLAGKDTAETYLAHSETGMGKHYHNPDFKRLAKALRKMRRRLAPMFAARKLAGLDPAPAKAAAAT